MELEKRLEIAKEAAKKAGKIQLEHLGNNHDIIGKGPKDFATEVDYKCEEAIVETIKNAFPEDGILAEEGGETKGENKYVWVIDPLDGTVNYAFRFPYFCVIIGLYDTEKNEAVMGVVHDTSRNKQTWAIKGQGAFTDGEKISASSRKTLKESLVSIGSFRDFDKSVNSVYKTQGQIKDHLEDFMRIRVVGSAGLDAVNVANGSSDAHLCIGLFPWDNIGSTVIIEEAGGKVIDNNGKKMSLESRGMLACNAHIFNELTSLLQKNE